MRLRRLRVWGEFRCLNLEVLLREIVRTGAGQLEGWVVRRYQRRSLKREPRVIR